MEQDKENCSLYHQSLFSNAKYWIHQLVLTQVQIAHESVHSHPPPVFPAQPVLTCLWLHLRGNHRLSGTCSLAAVGRCAESSLKFTPPSLSVPCVQADGAPSNHETEFRYSVGEATQSTSFPADLGQSHVPQSAPYVLIFRFQTSCCDFIASSSKYALDLYFAFSSLPFHKWGTASFSKITELLVKKRRCLQGREIP